MNFRKIYECNIEYENGTNGPFDKLDTPIRRGKEQKPAIKGTPNFKHDKAGYGPIPPTGLGRKDYNVKYSKNGGLLESEIKELKKLNILNEDFEDEDDDFIDDDNYEEDHGEYFDYLDDEDKEWVDREMLEDPDYEFEDDEDLTDEICSDCGSEVCECDDYDEFDSDFDDEDF